MPELTPEALDQLRRDLAVLRKLLVAHLAEHSRKGVNLTDGRRRVGTHLWIEARNM